MGMLLITKKNMYVEGSGKTANWPYDRNCCGSRNDKATVRATIRQWFVQRNGCGWYNFHEFAAVC